MHTTQKWMSSFVFAVTVNWYSSMTCREKVVIFEECFENFAPFRHEHLSHHGGINEIKLIYQHRVCNLSVYSFFLLLLIFFLNVPMMNFVRYSACEDEINVLPLLPD